MNPTLISKLIRCSWCSDDPLYQAYHDLEWGVPSRDDQHLFEMLILEGAQAGLSWFTVLKKRERYREVFDGFDAEKIAVYGPEKIAALLADPGIIRNRLKVAGTVKNARAYLQIREQYGSFSIWLWKFVGDCPLQNNFTARDELPVKTAISDLMCKELRRAGFTFVGSTICYAFMQAVGMVNDHTTDCFRHSELL